jgi:ATP-binding cassette subfamily B protein
LFSSSLRENLLLGRPGGEALTEALGIAQLQRDLDQLQAGLDAPVGPRGIALSGGQVQRAAVARALVCNPELLVLDDLSALDGPTESALWRQLRTPECTILAASHRRAALASADWIVVLREGRVLDEGPLDELLSRCEELRILWSGVVNEA